MNLVFVGNYPPRQCGIATFTEHISAGIKAAALRDGQDIHTSVVAINDKPGYEYPPVVVRTIDQQNRKDYVQAAEFINRSDIDAVVLQHEFGIFGGEAGSHILSFAERLRIPLVVTLHTVLRQPNDAQRLNIQRLGVLAQKLVVMSQLAVRMLHQVYRIPLNKIACIEHGSPTYNFSRRSDARQNLGLAQRHTILTFGHLGRGKGIRTAIEALPALKAVAPDFLYILLGKTHPHVLAQEGETYRESLWARVEELGLADNVRFDDKYADENLLMDYLLAADSYMLPYPNEAQATSGTLSYAVGAGCAVISTPFWHAKEILTEGRGLLFPFFDSAALGQQLVRLIESPELLQDLRASAKIYGQQTTWTQQGARYLSMIHQVVAAFTQRRTPLRRLHQLPRIDLQHILRMTDDTGMLQHASYHLPNRKEGYCLDDNARALMFAVQCLEQGEPRLRIEGLIDRYLGLMHYLQMPDGKFHNFIGYDRNYLDKEGSDDSLGRTVMALGYLLASDVVSQDHKDLAWQMYLSARPHLHELSSMRALAYSLIGLSRLATSEMYGENIPNFAAEISEFIIQEYEAVQTEDWHWFENVLTYGNAILPLAMLLSYRLTNNPRHLEVAEQSTRFLAKHTFSEHMIHPIGCHGFMRRGEEPCRFDQQPLDAAGMVMLYSAWYDYTHDDRDLVRATICFEWFTGHNDLGLSLFHSERGSCYDGLMERGLNQNQGAESTLAFWLARNRIFEVLAKSRAHEDSDPLKANRINIDLQGQLDEVVAPHAKRVSAA